MNPKFVKSAKFKQTQITNELEILKDHQFCKENQITNEPEILKEHQISKENQITNIPKI